MFSFRHICIVLAIRIHLLALLIKDKASHVVNLCSDIQNL